MGSELSALKNSRKVLCKPPDTLPLPEAREPTPDEEFQILLTQLREKDAHLSAVDKDSYMERVTVVRQKLRERIE